MLSEVLILLVTALTLLHGGCFVNSILSEKQGKLIHFEIWMA